MTSWHSYPKIWNLGHAALEELFFDEVIIEEKVDGSQFSFGLIDGEIKIRSKSIQMDYAHPEGMFLEARDAVANVSHLLTPNYTYRAEYLRKPKHNCLAYSRIPTNHLMIFDINNGEESYLQYDLKKIEAQRLGFECVPNLTFMQKIDVDAITSLMQTESMLGGVKIEGIVVKNYSRFGKDKKVLMGKYVSEAFKETNKTNWKAGNPGKADILDLISAKYANEMRWQKSVQHLKEKGELDGSPKDIGAIMAEARADLKAECSGEIADSLIRWALPTIERRCTRGLPEWYKKKLLEEQFK